MKQSTKRIVIVSGIVVVLGGLLAIAGPVIYRDFFAPQPAETPLLTAEDSVLSEASGEQLDPANLTGAWRVTDDSEAGYRVDEVLNGTDVTVTGRTTQVTGVFTVEGLTLTSAELTVDVASITTDSSSRDAYFRDTALRVAEYPTATFRLAAPLTGAAAPRVGETVEQELSGELTIAGVTQRVIFTAQLRTDGESAEIAGQIPITFADFGVTAPNLGFVAVEPTGFVEFDLVAQRG